MENDEQVLTEVKGRLSAAFDDPDFLVRLGDVVIATILREDPCFFERVNSSFFERLAQAGEISITPETEGIIIAALGLAGEPPSERELLDKHLNRIVLCQALRENLKGDEFLFGSVVDHLCFLEERSEAQVELHLATTRNSRPSNRRGGRTTKVAPTMILRSLLYAFDLAGGDFTLSRPDGSNYEGPLASYLAEVWKVLPSNIRPTAPEEFVRKAVRLRRAMLAEVGDKN